METIAVYWESTIRIYGMSIRSGLTLLRLAYPRHHDDFWCRRLNDITAVDDRFYLLTALVVDEESTQLSLLVDEKMAGEMAELLQECVNQKEHSRLFVDENVELLYLHGPHFQDRYGIADAAFSLLQKEGFTPLVFGCTGTSITIAVEAPQGRAAAQCLEKTFVVPDEVS